MTTTTTRKFGIEFEAHGLSISGAYSKLVAAGVPAALPAGHGSTTENRNGLWKVESDASLSNGFEAVTPPSTDFVMIRTALDALNNAGAYVSRQCGTHVHVDARDLKVEGARRLAKIWVALEGSMKKLVSSSRRANRFCKDSRSRFASVAEAWVRLDQCSTLMQVAYVMSDNRYAKLNFHAFVKHGTVEFRLHQGTLSADKIERWTRLCVRLVDLAHADLWNFAPENARDLDVQSMLVEVFRARQWPTATTATTTAAPIAATMNPATPTFTPRAGTVRAALWVLFDANPTATVGAAASIAEAAGFARKYATDQHWHWRRARSFAAPVVATPVVPAAIGDDVEVLTAARSYFSERAQELSAR